MVVRIVGTNAEEAAAAARRGALRHRRDAGRGGGEGGRGGRGARQREPREHPDRPRDAAARPGHHRPRGRVPHAGDARVRHPRRRRRHARQGRPDGARRRACRSSTPSRRRSARPAPNVVHLRSGRRRARRVWRRPTPGSRTIFCITEGIPVLDMIPVVEVGPAPAPLIGPNCPGATSPGECQGRDHPGLDPPRGPVGVVSRSGTLTYEAVQAMSDAGSASRRASGSAATPSSGRRSSTSSSCSRPTPPPRPRPDRRDRRHGRRGGRGLGRGAPPGHAEGGVHRRPHGARGKRMGHAGAIISGGRGTAASKSRRSRRRASASRAPPPSSRRSCATPATGAERCGRGEAEEGGAAHGH